MQKTIVTVFCIAFCIHNVKAATCPVGYVGGDLPGVVIADVCPSGTVYVGVVDSCMLATASGKCVIYGTNQESNNSLDVIDGKIISEQGTLYVISKAEMISNGPSGMPCWYNSSPKAYKECLYGIISGRMSK